ncbi:hypothetical protein [Aeromonas veronii]|uniref:hypothetical protein n=1 Tax=Aeromonas veronii TaxID=654 RepID=UPI0029371858|nr:hypothetical protein [Aeromonas veronii]WOE82887.1 hypothetical protein RY930_12360 [Aeromonas veronii]
MQVAVVEKTFRIVGKGSLIAQFTFISSGTLHIWFPDVGLQMEAHCKELRIEDCTPLSIPMASIMASPEHSGP